MRVFARLALLALLLSAVGCAPSLVPDPRLAAERARYLLVAEPQDPQSILDLRESLAGAGASAQEHEVVLVGHVGGNIEQPWSRGTAQFILADPSLVAAADDPHAGHACGDDCPYCKKRQEAELSGLALVQFLDDDGSVLPLDVRQLFGFDADQTVVVRGRARLDQAGNLVVAAQGLYLRR